MLASEQRYLAEIILTQLTIKVPNFGPKNSNFACKSQIFRISFQKMLRSLGLGLGLETFAKFLRVSVSVSKNLVGKVDKVNKVDMVDMVDKVDRGDRGAWWTWWTLWKEWTR